MMTISGPISCSSDGSIESLVVACPRRCRHIHHRYRQTQRLRQQAGSHGIGFGSQPAATRLCSPQLIGVLIRCRSALAREDAGTSTIVIARHNAFASEPAPTESWSPQVIGVRRILCRSALAREDAGTSAIVIARHNAVASKPAPSDTSPQVIGMLIPCRDQSAPGNQHSFHPARPVKRGSADGLAIASGSPQTSV